ncbi:hypothetical protein V1514DRAFT_345007 [Lipomyces japonicus]|uniref:uncharacterized protein n=1 Tax=Lipomyces japonicus TaxID=56871 RepID=UPI0034CEF071
MTRSSITGKAASQKFVKAKPVHAADESASSVAGRSTTSGRSRARNNNTLEKCSSGRSRMRQGLHRSKEVIILDDGSYEHTETDTYTAESCESDYSSPSDDDETDLPASQDSYDDGNDSDDSDFGFISLSSDFRTGTASEEEDESESDSEHEPLGVERNSPEDLIIRFTDISLESRTKENFHLRKIAFRKSLTDKEGMYLFYFAKFWVERYPLGFNTKVPLNIPNAGLSRISLRDVFGDRITHGYYNDYFFKLKKLLAKEYAKALKKSDIFKVDI